MAKNTWKDAQHHSSSGNASQNHNSTTHLSEQLLSKRQKITGVGDVKKKTTGRNAKC